MLSAEECRKKAENCLRLAKSAPNPEGRLQWQELSVSWGKVAEQRQALPERPQSSTITIRPVDLSESRRNDAVGIADVLRERLALTWGSETAHEDLP